MITNIDFKKIYEFTDFSECVRFNFNRSVRNDLLHKYKPLLDNGADMGYIILSPHIYTDRDGKKGYGILDGQHRAESYSQLKNAGKTLKPMKVIFYEDCPTDEEKIKDLIQNLNKGAHWGVNDFIKSNIEGDNDLKRLEDFCFAHNRLFTAPKTGKNKGVKRANMRRGAAYVSGNKTYYANALKTDSFKIDKVHWDEAETVYNEVEILLKGMKTDSLTDNPSLEGIILGWHMVRNDYTLRKMLEALPKGVEDLPDFMDGLDKRNTTKANEWKARFAGLVTTAYAKLV